MNTLVFLLFLGGILGIKHAFEADHILAVSTIVSEYRQPVKAAMAGILWGIGHTTVLLVVGALVLFLRVSIPEYVSNIFESYIGIMLLVLGIRAILRYDRHTHSHSHTHEESFIQYRPKLTKMLAFRPFIIGLFHGLAGSGALMILVLSSMPSVLSGLLYIACFGLGSVISMAGVSYIIGLPFSIKGNKFVQIHFILQKSAGILSILYGAYILYTYFPS